MFVKLVTSCVTYPPRWFCDTLQKVSYFRGGILMSSLSKFCFLFFIFVSEMKCISDTLATLGHTCLVTSYLSRISILLKINMFTSYPILSQFSN